MLAHPHRTKKRLEVLALAGVAEARGWCTRGNLERGVGNRAAAVDRALPWKFG